jgi:hypothetical protein
VSEEFTYALHPLPTGRVPFRRWRWELWHGASLLAAGWRLSPQHAERALSTAASRFAHARHGLHLLHPDRASALGRFGATVRIECGAITCVLVPRDLPA